MSMHVDTIGSNLRHSSMPLPAHGDKLERVLLAEFERATDEKPCIALSYYWGDSKAMPKVLRENVDDLTTDGLADDIESRKAEAPRMGIVYGNADSTIHAVDAVNSNAGPFPEIVETAETGVLESRGWEMPAPRRLKDLFVFVRNWRIPGTWWELTPPHTARNPTHESDRFLAINGVAAVAQCWAQIRNTWGLWMDFLPWELLCWSWASKTTGCIRNHYYERATDTHSVMFKCEVSIPYGTSFDQFLPIPAWVSKESQTITMKADLRPGEIMAHIDADDVKRYEVKLGPTGLWSDDEVYDFRPDGPSDFPVWVTKNVIIMQFLHMDVRITRKRITRMCFSTLKQKNGQRNLSVAEDYVDAVNLYPEHTTVRLGYLENEFKPRRYPNTINDELWWK
ncbi:HET-domain-containing protein [Xylariaceae sp. FL1651]|nr:HET-domain-containing protein [Xylariaceae sp. FL1651]